MCVGVCVCVIFFFLSLRMSVCMCGGGGGSFGLRSEWLCISNPYCCMIWTRLLPSKTSLHIRKNYVRLLPWWVSWGMCDLWYNSVVSEFTCSSVSVQGGCLRSLYTCALFTAWLTCEITVWLMCEITIHLYLVRSLTDVWDHCTPLSCSQCDWYVRSLYTCV